MTASQIEAREDFYRRVLDLPDEGFSQIRQYLEDMLPHFMSSHIPNEETQEAMAELRAGKGEKTNIAQIMAELNAGN